MHSLDEEKERILKTDRSEALEVLTEGILTYEKALEFKEEINKPIHVFVEGDTDKKYFLKACEIYAPNIIQKITFEGLGGKGQLKKSYK